MRLFQKDVAQQIGVDTTTIYNWERNANSPQIHQLPGVIRFLGYNPYPAAGSLSEKLTAARRALGLSQRAMAERLGIDPTTLARWEKGIGKYSRKRQQITGRLNELLQAVT